MKDLLRRFITPVDAVAVAVAVFGAWKAHHQSFWQITLAALVAYGLVHAIDRLTRSHSASTKSSGRTARRGRARR